jgi:signal transduction histidine kinase/CheY-like chemotaxis protein
VVAVVLVAAFVPLVATLGTTRDAERARDRADEQAEAAASVLGLVVDVQTGVRGYIIAEEPRFLEPARGAKRRLPGHLRRLVAGTAPGTRERALAASIERAARSYIDEWSDPLVAVAHADPRRASTIVATAEGKRRVDGIRDRSARLTSLTRAEAAQLQADQHRGEERAVRVAAAGLAAVLLIVLLAVLYLRRSIGGPVRRLADAAERLGEGRLETRVPEDGPREYARLARNFNSMAASLQSSRGNLEVANRDLEVARAEAQRANEAKSEFLSRMSHELRTPLNAVLGFAELLWMDGLSDERRGHVDQIRRSGRHLLDLINETLDISRIEAGQMSISPEPVLLGPAVAEAIEMIAPKAASRGISLEPDYGPASELCVRADQQRLKQVLLNLLSNAVKYNRPGGSVRVWCECRGDAPSVAVADTGRGVPEGQLERMFSPFERLGAEYGEEEGTGLGLALSRRLAELMDARLWAESEVASGTTFWLELIPADPPGHDPDPQPSGRDVVVAPGAANLTVLYIEDNASNVELIKGALARLGDPALLVATRGEPGIELALREQPDVVLLDLHLPDMPGTDVLARLKSDARTGSIPVIVLSADATERQVKRLLEGGAYAYLTKPVDIPRFLEMLQRAADDGGGSLR